MKHRMYNLNPILLPGDSRKQKQTSEITADAVKNHCVRASDHMWWIDVLFELSDECIISTNEILAISDVADLGESFADMDWIPE